MNEHINYLLRLNQPMPADSYRDLVVETLTAPAWYHPIQRYKFHKSFDQRVGLVMAEYAKDLIHAIGGNTKTDNKVDNWTNAVKATVEAANQR